MFLWIQITFDNLAKTSKKIMPFKSREYKSPPFSYTLYRYYKRIKCPKRKNITISFAIRKSICIFLSNVCNFFVHSIIISINLLNHSHSSQENTDNRLSTSVSKWEWKIRVHFSLEIQLLQENHRVNILTLHSISSDVIILLLDLEDWKQYRVQR